MAKILVVEDNFYSRDILVRRLARAGYQVVAALDGAQAVQLALSERPDLILLDIRLPVMDGYEVARRLRAAEETRNTPIIAMTAYAIEESRQEALAAGCNDYETKPLDFAILTAKMEALLKKHPAEAPDLPAPQSASVV